MEAALHIVRMRPRKQGTTWVYPRLAEVLRAVCLRTVREYIATRLQTAAALIFGRPVLEEFRRTERRGGTATCPMWWDQDINWEAAYEAADKNTWGPDENLDLKQEGRRWWAADSRSCCL